MSLTDLLKQRNSTVNDVQVKKFKLPSIFGQKSTASTLNVATDASTAQPIKFSNLSELANAHLSTSKLVNDLEKISLSENINIPKQSKFIIPKLNGGSGSVSPSSGESLTPHEMSLKKIMDLKRLHISTTNNTENTPPNTVTEQLKQMSLDTHQFPIDLTSALNGPNFSSSIIAPAKHPVEKIDFKFIDCDIAEVLYQPYISKDCCLNISNILEKQFDTRTKGTSAFGKILCSRYKRKKQSTIQNIQHGFVNKHQIKPFRFDIINKSSK